MNVTKTHNILTSDLCIMRSSTPRLIPPKIVEHASKLQDGSGYPATHLTLMSRTGFPFVII